MLRKCLQDEDIPYPHSVIDFYDGIKIIDIPETYTVYQPLTDSEGEPIIEQTGLDEDGNPIYEQMIGPVEIEVDVESVGEEASWYDVRNPCISISELTSSCILGKNGRARFTSGWRTAISALSIISP